MQGCNGVGKAFPHPFALVTLLEDVGSKRLQKNMAAVSQMCWQHADSHC